MSHHSGTSLNLLGARFSDLNNGDVSVFYSDELDGDAVSVCGKRFDIGSIPGQNSAA